MAGATRDNIFSAFDVNDKRCGIAAVTEYVNHALFPDHPLNYYITLEGFGRARDMLFGAAYARARILRAAKPNLPARIYSSCSPRDPERLMFLSEMGLSEIDSEYILRRPLKRGDTLAGAPVGTEIRRVPLETHEARERFIVRANQYALTARSLSWLESELSSPFAIALAVVEEERLLGEVFVTASGAEGHVHNIYTLPHVRRRGIARALISASIENLSDSGYLSVSTSVTENLRGAMLLFERAGFVRSLQATLYPGVYL